MATGAMPAFARGISGSTRTLFANAFVSSMSESRSAFQSTIAMSPDAPFSLRGQHQYFHAVGGLGVVDNVDKLATDKRSSLGACMGAATARRQSTFYSQMSAQHWRSAFRTAFPSSSSA